MSLQYIRSTMNLILIGMIFLTSCIPGTLQSTDSQISLFATPSNEPILAQSGLEIESAAVTITHTPRSTPTNISQPSSTPSPTRTISPTQTRTPTITLSPTTVASPTPDRVMPGFYNGGGCATVFYGYIDFCVLSITVKRDYHMIVTVSWQQNVKSVNAINKKSDENNKLMYMVDNLGNRYNHFAGGGVAYSLIEMGLNETVFGWYEFGPPPQGAFVFDFYDDNQNVVIENIALLNPVILSKDLILSNSSLILEYRTQLWEAIPDVTGAVVITHKKMPTCTLQENLSGPPQGKYKNRLEIGEIEYVIYGYIDQEKNLGIREYLAVDEQLGVVEGREPFLLVTIPFENSQDCIFDVSEMLATLQRIQQ